MSKTCKADRITQLLNKEIYLRTRPDNPDIIVIPAGRLPPAGVQCGFSSFASGSKTAILDTKKRITIPANLLRWVRQVDNVPKDIKIRLSAVVCSDPDGNRWLSHFPRETLRNYIRDPDFNAGAFCALAIQPLEVDRQGRVLINGFVSVMQSVLLQEQAVTPADPSRLIVGGFLDHIRVALPATFQHWQEKLTESVRPN